MNMLEDQKILEEEFKGDSDRAAAIVGASYLDELLREIILEYLVEDTSKNNKELFSGNGPLSTFSSRINLSYRFGIISENERMMLHGIRGIRNEFAHKLAGASFSDESIKQRSLNLSVPREMLMPNDIPIPRTHEETVPLPTIVKADESDPRAIYQEAVTHVALLLRGRQAHCSQNKLRKVESYTRATAPGREILRVHETLLERYESLIDKAKQLGKEIDQEDKEALHRQDVLYRVNKYCLDQADRAHSEKNYA
ncbi:mannitol operon repressor [Alishewanella jeotgali KCTC 22429]|uniref:Mannitol operon repressor n=2 Tax=Alishewanella jeotgali TaxID=545533 RepID=H3ZJ58_9ALTE|nr:mannitol operon repressor [Alishewanella jeotgali KCTC 22429]